MTDIQLYTKLSSLPTNLKKEVADFIDFMKYKSEKKSFRIKKRLAGQAKGLISMKDNFDDPIEGFKEYM
ncbi:MAG: DUF2281 domain-containing protein [Bacteroidota bacterium]|nr:DUF2281 domain-containing protein [Bacteroidota bacterium]